MSDENKKFKRLSQYAVIMILAAVIIIIIAAMADDREQNFESQIYEKEQINMNIQNEIVRLKDENYTLGKERDSLKTELDSTKAAFSNEKLLSEAMRLSLDGLYNEAEGALTTLNVDLLDEKQKETYDIIKDMIEEGKE